MRRSSACAAHAHLSTEPLHLLTFLSLLACRRRWALAFGGVSTAALLLIGACAGAAGQASAHPLDVVRRRMQMEGLRKKFMADDKSDAKLKKPPVKNLVSGSGISAARRVASS